MLTRPHALLNATWTSSLTPSLVLSNTISNTSYHTNTERFICDRWKARRCYASAARDGEEVKNDDTSHVWPATPKGHLCPTPYQIFSMTTTENYSKARFYSLVKLYHPDRGSLDHICPHHVRLERYRLIVAAHNLLSDPHKRSAYDRLGMGWQGRAEVKTTYGAGTTAGPFSHNWQDPNDSVWSNATWEDWERYYERKQAKQNGTSMDDAQKPVFLSNTMFLGLVFVVIFCGSAFNYGRAQNNGQYFVEQRDIIHDRAAKELRKVKMEKQTMGSQQDRIEWFVRQREATMGVAGSDPETLRQEMADRILPNRDVCRSEEIVQEASKDTG